MPLNELLHHASFILIMCNLPLLIQAANFNFVKKPGSLDHRQLRSPMRIFQSAWLGMAHFRMYLNRVVWHQSSILRDTSNRPRTAIMMHKTVLNVLGLVASAAAQQAHMMRFACSQLTVERLDPLVNPGVVGSPHTHQIVGGNSFRAEMKPLEHDLVERSTCTSCTFSEGTFQSHSSPRRHQTREHC